MLRRIKIFSVCVATTLLTSVAALHTASFAGQNKDGKTPTPEQIAQAVLFYTSPQTELAQIRRNGVERGRLSRTDSDARTEEITYERRFIRGESPEKDRVRVDQKTSATEYSLVYAGGRVWGLVEGSAFTPREDATSSFLTQMRHDIEPLLRYKENKATLTLVGKEKQKNIDLWVLDLTDQEKRRTRYYISAKSWHVLALEYEQAPPPQGGEARKFKKTYHDYRYTQGTLVPYRTVLYVDGKQTEEKRVLTVTYSIKMEETLFQNPETTASGG